MTGIVLLVAIGTLSISIIIYTLLYGISPMPTSGKSKVCILSMLPNEANGTLFELGSGWGTLVFSLAKKYPKCSIVAYEISPIPFLFSKCRQLLASEKNITISRKNFLKMPLNEAKIVVCYLYPDAMEKLKSKFEQELAPGTMIISNTFAIPGWKPEEVREVNDIYRTRIYRYRII